MTLRFATVCSGIEAASTAWKPLGWQPVFFSEIDKFPCAVLAHHYPDVPNHGDMTKFKDWPDADIDVLAGGTPCQSFSNAGLRAGLDDPRGQLMLTFGAIAARYRPRWLVWENVTGVLSSNGGRDFGSFLRLLGFLGYGFAYRVLDAQYVRVDGYARAVPQRRQRVFVVGCLGDWRSAAAVLLERESLRGDPAPRRQAGARSAARPAQSVAIRGREGIASAEMGGEVANAILTPSGGRGGIGVGALLQADGADSTDRNALVAYGGNNTSGPISVSSALSAHGGSGRMDFESETFVAHTLRGDGFDASEDGTGRGTPLVPVPFDTTQITSAANRSNPKPGDPCHPLVAGGHAPAIAFPAAMSGTQCATSEDLSPAIGAANRTAVMTGGNHANAKETGPCDALRELFAAVGEEAFDEWRSAVIASLQPEEILRQEVHGGSVRCETEQTGCRVGDGALPRAPGLPAGSVSEMRQAGSERRSPQGRGLPEQLVRELDEALSKLPHEGTPPAWLVRDVWRSGQGIGVLQQALSAAQGRAAAVRRLTPREAERLMGFPDDYTLIPHRGKPAADGPRYKALGNSWAINCARWVGQRIQMVNDIKEHQ